jgi:hypothetical protein
VKRLRGEIGGPVFLNANGVVASSPGLARLRAYPGSQGRKNFNLNEVAAGARHGHNLVEVENKPLRLPRVGSQAIQPWAGGHNAVGVEQRRLASQNANTLSISVTSMPG